MASQCYALIRGSALRVTGLDRLGRLPDSIQYAVSRSVIKVTIDEMAESSGNEMLSNDDEERRLLLVRSGETIRYMIDIEFLRVDPGVFSLIAGAALVYRDVPGFGEVPFGLAPFGGDLSERVVVGFDAITKIPVSSFALEVWSNLAGYTCSSVGFDEGGFDESGFGGVGAPRQWGYTLFPFLKGGYLSGFTFANGLVSFTLRQAQTRRGSRWGIGPYVIDGEGQRLVQPVSRNLNWRQTIVTGAPPAQTEGIVEFTDVIEGGTASMTSEDVVDGEFAVTSSDVVDGGAA